MRGKKTKARKLQVEGANAEKRTAVRPYPEAAQEAEAESVKRMAAPDASTYSLPCALSAFPIH